MENYRKGRNIEEELEKTKIPIPNLPPDFLWMQVKPGSKITNLLEYALTKFPKETKCIVWSGSGAAVSKTISCVEIMKRKMESVHQITRICYRKVEEYWEPKIPDLDEIVVNRNIPTIHIQLSVEPLNKDEQGYQFYNGKKSKVMQNRRPHGGNKTPTEQFAALGVKDNKRRHKPYNNKSKNQQS